VEIRWREGVLGVVASANDIYVSIFTAQRWVRRWRSHFINLGRQGHINIEAGFGNWPEGFTLYEI
jgi:predicted alpha/beta hydrolase family esterase